jgi:hypothetical protein
VSAREAGDWEIKSPEGFIALSIFICLFFEKVHGEVSLELLKNFLPTILYKKRNDVLN